MVPVSHCILRTVIEHAYVLGVVLDTGLRESPNPCATQSLEEEKVSKEKSLKYIIYYGKHHG